MSHLPAQSAVAPKISHFEYLRFLSILGVVLIHATAPYLVSLAATEDQVSPIFTLLVSLNQAARFSVPAFFFMAGFFMAYGRKDSFTNRGDLQAYISKRLLRLLLPYLTWSLLLYVIPMAVSRDLKITSTLIAIVLGATFEGGYFIIALAQLSVLGPILYNRFHNKVLPYVILIISCLLITELYYVISVYGQGTISRLFSVGFSLFLCTFVPWLPIYLSGLLLGQRHPRWSDPFVRLRPILVILLLASFLLSVLDFFLVYQRNDSLNIAASFIKPTSIAFACLFIVYILSQPLLGLSHRSLWKPVAGSSYSIYLLHGAVLSIMFKIDFIRSHVLIGLVLMVAFGLTLPLIIDYFISRIAPAWIELVAFGKVSPQPPSVTGNHVKGLM